jgi:hypothetical protein
LRCAGAQHHHHHQQQREQEEDMALDAQAAHQQQQQQQREEDLGAGVPHSGTARKDSQQHQQRRGPGVPLVSVKALAMLQVCFLSLARLLFQAL